MKIAKKSLSMLLSLLMIFTACSIGFEGIVASAAEGDSEYTVDEVAALINAATAGGFTLSSSGNAWNYTGDDGKVIAAAQAIFDYAVNTYRDGKEADSKANSSKGLYDAFDATFSSKYTNAVAARQLVKNVLNPDGTTVYSYENPGKKTGITCAETTTSMSAGTDVTGTYPVASYPNYYASSVTGTITKTAKISLDLNKYLMTFGKIEDIPSTIITGVEYTYAHTYSSSAKVTSVTSRDETTGSGCNASTTTYYTPTIETSYWNYMTGKPTKAETKDKTVRKGLLTVEKYFNEELIGTTFDDMLAMDVTDIKVLYDTTDLMYTTNVVRFSDEVLAHFGLNPAVIHKFMEDLDFAYRITAAKYNIDNLNDLIGTEYNTESYAEMSALYAKTNTAYNVVFNLKTDVVEYLNGTGNYSEQYASALALKTAAESYNAILLDIMTEQKLEETVASMVDTYTDYINVLNKEDVDNPSDAEVVGLVQKVEAFDAIIASYTGKSYYRTYWTTEYESEWARFSGILDEVAEVRGLKEEFETYYSYFLPLIFTAQMNELDNESLIALHSELDTKLSELRTSYTDVAGKWGYTIADKIFTVNYEGSDYLLQTLVDSVKSAGKEAAKTILIARTEAQLDAVYAYKDTTTVTFENFASIKSTLTYFDYDLYNYVNGGGDGQNKWLSTDYTNKYSMVQTLLDRYHAFSTSDGKSYFNESFTFADANGNFAIRYAGSQFDAEGVQIGYPSDLVRDGADDNYYVTEEKMLDTVARLDNFITSRDFGAIIGLVDTETEEYCDLPTYVTNMLNEMLFTDDLINTLVGAIYPMVVDLLNTELVGMLADMGENDNPNASACIDLKAMEVDNATGHLYVYMDDDLYNGNEHLQRNLDEVLADAGLYVYPQTLADSLLMSNPVAYGVGTPVYTALKAAGRDWTYFTLSEDKIDEETGEVIAAKDTIYLDFEWGVYDAETFTDAMACIFDSLLPLLNAVLTGTTFNETLNNAAYVYSSDVKYSIISAGKIAAYGHLNLNIPGLTVYNDVLVPLFEILGVDKIPTLKSGASGDDLAKAIIDPLLSVIDEILLGKDAAPLTKILEILPNLVYFLSMDSVQEILDSLNIALNLKIEAEIDKDKSGTLADLLGGTLISLLGDNLAFDVELAIADMIDLYDMLGFEISDFNEILKLVTEGLGLELPPIKQQEIIFCSDWGTSPTGRVYLHANEGDLMYWLLDYVLSALTPDEDGNSLLNSLLGEDMDPQIASILGTVVSQITTDRRGALAALIELLNPEEYDLAEMDWVESEFTYGDIEGATAVTNIYLSYNNDWTQEKADYLVDNIDTIVTEVLKMVEMDLGDAEDLGGYLQGMLAPIFTNANITALVEMLGGFGDSPSAFIEDIIATQIGIDINSWFIAFGYLYPVETWAEDAEIVPNGHRNYVNNFGVEGTLNEDGTITWSVGKMNLVDGDAYGFMDIVLRLLGPASKLIDFLFAGGDISAFNDVVKLKGYETYETTLGMLLTLLGVQNLPTQEDFNNNSMAALSTTIYAVLDWFYALTSSDDMIAQLLEIVPDLFYFIESNGLSVFLKNLLMPVLVLVDTVRPILDVDINGVLSMIVSDFLNYGELNIDNILDYVVGTVPHNNDLEYKYYNIDIDNLRLSDIIGLVDTYLGTNLKTSGLVEFGLKGVCSGVEVDEYAAVADYHYTTVTAADTMTLLVTGVLDCLGQPAQEEGKTNGDVIFALLAELTGNDMIADLMPAINAIVNSVPSEKGHVAPDWGYFLTGTDTLEKHAPKPSIAMLDYSTDWTEDAAKGVYSSLDDILELVLPSLLEENETLQTLVEGLIADNLYSDALLNELVELIVNAIADFDAFYGLVKGLLGVDAQTWKDLCEYDEEAEKWICTHDFGIDEAADADKKGLFIAALQTVIAPANSILSWLFFGDDIAFFTGSVTDAEGNYLKDDNGNYLTNDVIRLEGVDGYAYGLAPIFEALGLTMKPAEEYYNAEAGSYDVDVAVADILNEVFGLLDNLATTESAIAFVFDLLPNLIYFINADGLKASVDNILLPVEDLLNAILPLVVTAEEGEEITLGGLLEDAIGLDITNLTTETLLGLAGDNGVVLSNDMVDLICNLYVGKLEAFTSCNGNTAYRLNVEGYEHDVLTIVLSIALELFTLNGDLFGGLFEEGQYEAILALIKGATDKFQYMDIDWAYMYEDTAEKTALEQLQATNANGIDKFMPEYPDDSTAAIYLQYQNNWNKNTAEYVDTILDALVDSFFDDGSSLGKLLDDAVTNGLYQDDILNSLLESVVGLIADYADIVEGAGALIGAESISKWFDYCDITTDEDGNTVVTVIHDFGIDEAETNAEKRELFVEAFVDVLEPAYRILAWLFFAEDLTFFKASTGETIVTLKGGRGYEEGLVPLFEALGVVMAESYDAEIPVPGSPDYPYANGKSGVLPVSAFYTDGELDMEKAVRAIFMGATDWLNMICGDLAKQETYGTIGTMLELLPNVIYNINAGTLKAVVNNLLLPVEEVLKNLKAFGLEVDFNALIEDVALKDLDWYEIFDLVEGLVHLYWPDNIQDFLANLYIGKAVEFTSANGEKAYFMTYNEDCASDDFGYLVSSRADMTTLVISFVIDGALDPRNEAQLVDWLGQDVYDVIYAYISNQAKTLDMQEFEWALKEYADTGVSLSPLTVGSQMGDIYGELYTKEMGAYIEKWLPSFVDTTIVLLGIETEEGDIYAGLEDILDTLIGDTIYTNANLEAILGAIQGLIPSLKESLDPALFDVIVNVLNNALEVDVTYWDTYEINAIEDGDRVAFVDELVRMLRPAAPVLEWLLTDKPLIALFTVAEGRDAVVIEGAEGYAYGIIPLLEAFGYDNESILTPEAYVAAAEKDADNLLKNIINPLLDVVDTILADPVNEIFKVLPGVIYFLNSNGLDTVIKNTANAVFAVLENIEPLTGELDIYELIGFDATELNIDTILEQLLADLEESTGLEFKDTALQAIRELTVGEVISYTSKNGKTAYTMVYADQEDRNDMVSVVIRAALSVVTIEENAAALKEMLKGELSDEGYDFVVSLLDNFVQMAKSENGMEEILYTVYQIFYAANVAVHSTDNWLTNFNGDYTFIGDLFATSELPFLQQIGSALGGMLDNGTTDDIINSEGVATNGLIKFFEAIRNFFQKIADFFAGLFN